MPGDGNARGRRDAPREHRQPLRTGKISVAVERFEVNPSKPELVQFLNEQADE